VASPSDPGVEATHTDGVVVIRLTRAAKRNAIPQEGWRRLARIVEDASADPAMRVGVLESSTSGVFSAGADLAEAAIIATRDAATQRAALGLVEAACSALRVSRLPWVAVVDGPCRGAAVALICACDLRIVSTRTSILVPAARNGSAPLGRELPAIAATFGIDVARQLVLGTHPLEAGHPAFSRLATHEVGPEKVDQTRADVVQGLAELSAATVSAAKAVLAQVTDQIAAVEVPDFRPGGDPRAAEGPGR
jgi:enoyl-CoA hydratase/carnithine racemase